MNIIESIEDSKLVTFVPVISWIAEYDQQSYHLYDQVTSKCVEAAGFPSPSQGTVKSKSCDVIGAYPKTINNYIVILENGKETDTEQEQVQEQQDIVDRKYTFTNSVILDKKLNFKDYGEQSNDEIKGPIMKNKDNSVCIYLASGVLKGKIKSLVVEGNTCDLVKSDVEYSTQSDSLGVSSKGNYLNSTLNPLSCESLRSIAFKREILLPLLSWIPVRSINNNNGVFNSLSDESGKIIITSAGNLKKGSFYKIIDDNSKCITKSVGQSSETLDITLEHIHNHSYSPGVDNVHLVSTFT